VNAPRHEAIPGVRLGAIRATRHGRARGARHLARVIGARIFEARLARSMNLWELARRSNILSTEIRNYEAGRRLPPLDRLHRIATSLEIELRELMP